MSDAELQRLLETEFDIPPEERKWSFANREKPIGPYSEARIHRLITQGEIRADTLVWRRGMPEWANAEDVEEFAARFAKGKPRP